DNAARYSPPTEPVVVSGKEVPNGVGIEIQDSGKGLSEEKKRAAEHSLAGTAAGPGLGGISEDANIGLRVVGILARRYGIRVTFADSPWLGTSVVVVVPHKYFSPLPAASAAPAPATAAPAAASPVQAHGPVAVETVTQPESGEIQDTTPGGLPRRRSRRREEEQPQQRTARTRGTAFPAVPPEESFAGLAAFATAGRAPAADEAVHSEAELTGDEDDVALATPDGADDAADGRGSAEHRTEESD
ncbi:ATP-binding protein, partial [Streptomyces sp. NPDC127079]